MIQRFFDQVFHRMSPERRARKLSVMKALARNSFRNKNKENEDPLNNNMALPLNFQHSTPLKSRQTVDLDVTDSEQDPEVELSEAEIFLNEESELSESQVTRLTEPELVIAKIYDRPFNGDAISSQNLTQFQQNEYFKANVCVPEITEDEKTKPGIKKKNWRSVEVLDQTAEHEFCRSLEESKLFVSTSSLLEEIEADLPSSYKLGRPLNHTFHTLTSYRTITRLARMDVNLTCPEILENRESLEVQVPSKKLEYLEMEATVQKALAKQAKKALILSKAEKFMGVEHFESEKTFLLANMRYTAAIQELEKLKMLGEVLDHENFGHITISDVYFPVVNAVENNLGIFICTATEGENVQSTSLLDKITDGKLHFEEPFKFQNLRKDFVIYIELFRFNYKEPKVAIATSIMRKLKKMTNVTSNKSSVDSSIISGGFTCVAGAELRLQHVTNRENEKCTLYFYQIPHYPIAEGSVTVFLNTHLNMKTKQRGFLNVFKQTWHRRWYSQSGYFLESWLYPEDEECDKPHVDSIYLPDCSSKVKAVGLDVCIRPHSFVIFLGQNNGEILFSADSQKDMIKWIDHLNLIMEHINLWKPNV